MKSRHLAVLAATTLAASGCGIGVHFADHRYTRTLPDAHINGKVTDIEVSSSDGHVHVTAGSGGVTVHRVVHYQTGTPHPGQQLSGGTLTFTRGCSRCSIDYDLTVPASVAVRARADSGSVVVSGVARADAQADSGGVTVTDVKGDVSAHTDSGSVKVRDVTGDLDAHADSGGLDITNVGGALTASTSSGTMRATGLRSSTVRASSDSGGIRLTFSTPPTDVRATADSGGMRLRLPGGPYSVDASSDSGGRDIGVPTSPDARSHLYLRTDSGGISVAPA